MAYHVTHVFGDMDTPSAEDFRTVLGELGSADQEHSEVSLSHESGWTISVSAGGRLVLENIEERGSARHMVGLDPLGRDKERILEIWASLAQGELDKVTESFSWEPGYK
jgi:hypothetical protein